jgi:fumarate hydratase subunit alpha
MRTVNYHDIVTAVRDICIRAACDLPADVYTVLTNALKTEQSPRAQSILAKCLENAAIAKKERLPLCQDTGFAVFFVTLGSDVSVQNGHISDAITEGTKRGYQEGWLRKSIVSDPVFDRINTTDNSPPVIHYTLIPGSELTITIAPKGGGSENTSAIAMLKPSDGKEGIIKFVTDTVIKAGGNSCPPTIVGVGIGGTFETAALLAKKALIRPLGCSHPDSRYKELEQKILSLLNASDVGPQGLGGTTTALAVHIETHPCHIASLPVAVNMNCHAARHASLSL